MVHQTIERMGVPLAFNQLKFTKHLIILALACACLGGARPKINIAFVFPPQDHIADPKCLLEGYVKEVSPNLPFELKLLYYPSPSLESVIKSFSQIKKSEVRAVIGPRTSQEAIILSNKLNKEKIPMIAPLASHPDVVSGKKTTIRMLSNSYRYSDLISKFIISQLDPKRLAIVKNLSAPYSTFYADETSKNISRNPNVAIKQFNIVNGFKEFGKLRDEIGTYRPNVVYMPVYSEQAMQLLVEFSKLKIPLEVVSQGGIHDAVQYFKNGEFSNSNIKLYVNAMWSNELKGRKVGLFQKIIKEHCPSHIPHIRNVASFDALDAVAESLVIDPTLKGEALIDSIIKEGHRGLLGNLKFNPDREPLRDMYLMEVFRGKTTIHKVK